MQRIIPSGPATLGAVLSILALSFTPACKDEKVDDGKQAAKSPTENGDAKSPAEAGADTNAAAGNEAAGSGSVAPAGDGGGSGEAPAAEGGSAEAGTAEPTNADAGEPAAPAEDVVPGLFEQAKSLDTDDEAAKKALEDAIAAGGGKLDAAKIANERGEKLMSDGESERAAVFFQWAADTHKVYAEPVYNLATLAAYAGDLDIAKEHLQELAKRGNKKLMKKVGVDPAFALLVDDPDVRKIYEQ